MSKDKSTKPKSLECGLVMPISAMDGYSAEHWIEVKSIITDAVKDIDVYAFDIKLVSDADDIGVIQKRIVQNLYHSDIVICDVSGKNPNVMFELGMRLAFDKPTIIIKDNKTGYSFDTGVIEHLEYPSDLRFSKIVDFKSRLAKSVAATYQKSISDEDHSTFLKNFGEFKVAQLTESTVSADKMILSMLDDMQRDIKNLKSKTQNPNGSQAFPTLTHSEQAQLNAVINVYKSKLPKDHSKILFGDPNFYNFVSSSTSLSKRFSGRELEKILDDYLVPF